MLINLMGRRDSGTRLLVTAKPLMLAGAAFLALTAGAAGENASNPLAALNNTDLRYKYKAIGGSDQQEASIDGSYMVMPTLKLKYELNYNSTDVSGKRENDFETGTVKAIYFPSQGRLNDTWAVKTAVGLEWVVDFSHNSSSIGAGSDQLAPLIGVAFSNSNFGLTLIPLVQHFQSYNGPNYSQTALRLIAIQPFAEDYWAKMDLKVPYNWDRETWPASTELQLGYNFTPTIAAYTDMMVGMRNARPYDLGLGVGLRFNY